MKQVDPTQDQDSESVQAQNMEENEVPDAKDTSNMQYKITIQIHKLMVNNQTQIYLMIRHQEHHRKIVIKLLLTMMSRMTQYNLVIQSPNHFCHEGSEYPLQR